MSFKKLTACLTVAAMMLAVFSVALAQSINGVEPDFTNGVVRVTGKGVGMSKHKNNPGKFLLTAEKAARMDAQAKLVEYIEVQVETNSTMTESELEESIVKTSAKGIIRNAREVGEPKHWDNGTCTVVMEMPLFGGAGSIAEVAYLPFKDEPKVAFPQPSSNVAQSTGGTYTGLIIDCKGKKLEPVMSPLIKNTNNQPIYGHKNLDYDKIIVNGMASYANSRNDEICRSRAGNNPLVIEATNITDVNKNPVVSISDADRILAANQRGKFLENCAVVFVNFAK